VLGYTPPDARAIRECPDCGYRGVLAVDKHRPAPMSEINWEIRCPECNQAVEGPLHLDKVAEYIDLTRGDEIMGTMIGFGNYAAYKTVRVHNSRFALSSEKIEELTAASECDSCERSEVIQ